MCFVKAPKAPGAQPPPQYMHNQFLDGENSGQGITMGRNSLRTDLNTAGSSGLNVQAQPQARPTATPGRPALPPPINLQALSRVPGTVVPTIGGALVGGIPGSLTAGK